MPANVQPFAKSEIWANLFWFSYFVWFIMEMWIRYRERRKPEGVDADSGSAVLIIFMILSAIAGAFAAAFIFPWGRIKGPAQMLFYGGIAMVWGGMMFRLWAVLTLGRFFRTSVFVHNDHTLITHGPYHFLRHPSYTGSLVTLAGIGFALDNWLSVLIATVLPLLAFVRRILVEEKALAARFGEAFEKYKCCTWSLLPFIW